MKCQDMRETGKRLAEKPEKGTRMSVRTAVFRAEEITAITLFPSMFWGQTNRGILELSAIHATDFIPFMSTSEKK